jgi:hypothetical protein
VAVDVPDHLRRGLVRDRPRDGDHLAVAGDQQRAREVEGLVRQTGIRRAALAGRQERDIGVAQFDVADLGDRQRAVVQQQAGRSGKAGASNSAFRVGV